MFLLVKRYLRFLKRSFNNIYFKMIDYLHFLINPNKIRIYFFNTWAQSREDFETDWFFAFFKKYFSSFYISAFKPTIAVYQVFGKRRKIKRQKENINLFFTGENVFSDTITQFTNYSDHRINEVDLAFGFSPPKTENTLELPLWIFYFFAPTDDKDIIRSKWQLFNKNFTASYIRHNFAALIARHDTNGIRKEIFDALKNIDTISCPGKLFNNTNTLKENYNDDKITYLKDCQFNICPENSYSEKYVTEKLFQSLFSGAIPIYWGGITKKYDDIINFNCYFKWEKGCSNDALLKEIHKLHIDNELFRKFKKQLPIHIDNATDFVFETLHQLDLLFFNQVKQKKIASNLNKNENVH